MTVFLPKTKIDDQNKLIDNLLSYLFSARLRKFKIEENEEFTCNISERVKIRKYDSKIFMLFSYGFVGDLIDKVYDRKRNTFIQRITNNSIPDTRVILSKRKYFTLRDLALHLILLSVDSLKTFKLNNDFTDIKSYDMNIFDGIHAYMKYVNDRLGVLEDDILFIIEDNLANMIKGESPDFIDFMGERA